MANYLNRRKGKSLRNKEVETDQEKEREAVQRDSSQVATRCKIKLGELMVKAGLHEENVRTVLLGALLEIREKMRSNRAEEYRRHWWLKGDQYLSMLAAEKMKQAEQEMESTSD